MSCDYQIEVMGGKFQLEKLVMISGNNEFRNLMGVYDTIEEAEDAAMRLAPAEVQIDPSRAALRTWLETGKP